MSSYGHHLPSWPAAVYQPSSSSLPVPLPSSPPPSPGSPSTAWAQKPACEDAPTSGALDPLHSGSTQQSLPISMGSLLPT